MDTPVALIDPTPVLKELEQLVSGAQDLVKIREGYAKDCAYDALIKTRHNNDPKVAEKAAQCAF